MRTTEAVSVDTAEVWGLLELYTERYRKGDRSARVGLDCLTYLFADTPIGDEISTAWFEATGGDR